MFATSVMRPLPPAAVDRLIKIIGLIASNHDGEVVAAARQATRLLREHGCTWGELLQPALMPPSPERPRPGPAPRRGPVDWRVTAAACLQRPSLFTSWERDFLDNLLGFQRLSPKQQVILARLVERVRVAAGGAP